MIQGSLPNPNEDEAVPGDVGELGPGDGVRHQLEVAVEAAEEGSLKAVKVRMNPVIQVTLIPYQRIAVNQTAVPMSWHPRKMIRPLHLNQHGHVL